MRDHSSSARLSATTSLRSWMSDVQQLVLSPEDILASAVGPLHNDLCAAQATEAFHCLKKLSVLNLLHSTPHQIIALGLLRNFDDKGANGIQAWLGTIWPMAETWWLA